jgi:MOSC domain-containing protein YiiM
MIASPRVIGVRVGKIAPLGPRGVPSAFMKTPVAGRVAVGLLGLGGDAQADLRVHGGPDKAVYAYPAAAYAAWRATVPHYAARLIDGAMGENLTIDGWGDADVAIGDRVRIGSAVLQVSEPRMPCFKVGLAFGDPAMVRAFADVGVSGWYYRVVETGTIGIGDSVTLLDRTNPDWTIAQFCDRHRWHHQRRRPGGDRGARRGCRRVAGEGNPPAGQAPPRLIGTAPDRNRA